MVGAAPSFSVVHLARTLFILREGKAGRKRLVVLLGVGEGSVRTIIKRLSGAGFLSSDQGGHSLSEKGRKALSAMLKKFTQPKDFFSSDISDKKQSIVLVHGAAGRIRKGGVDERDVAVRAGADGAVILSFRQGKLRFPSDGFDAGRFPDLMLKLGSLDLSEGDVAVISFACSSIKAEDAALAVALELSPASLLSEVA